MSENTQNGNGNPEFRAPRKLSGECKPNGECIGSEQQLQQQPYDVPGMVPVQYSYEPEMDEAQYEGNIKLLQESPIAWKSTWQ